MIGNLTGPTSISLMIPNIAFATSIPAPVINKIYFKKTTQFVPFKEESIGNFVRKNILHYILSNERLEIINTIFSTYCIKFKHPSLWWKESNCYHFKLSSMHMIYIGISIKKENVFCFNLFSIICFCTMNIGYLNIECCDFVPRIIGRLQFVK